MSVHPFPHLRDPGVLRFLTAGSVDDGKSTLIGRLLHDTRAILADQLEAVRATSARRGAVLDLSLLTDGLIAEREQGITIDVAYRYFATPRRKFIIADAPGHEQYTRNMVTAASTADAAALLVDVRHGIVAQTRRHATLAHRVGVRSLVVAVNKMDLVDWDRSAFERVAAAFAQFAGDSGIEISACIPMSAAIGDMVVERGDHFSWYRGPTLIEWLERVEPERLQADVGLRFPVQFVARPVGDEPRRYLGRVEAGSVRVGDAVTVLPSGRTTRVAAIRTWNDSRDHAAPLEPVGLVLADDVDVSRGDLVVSTATAPPLANELVADLCWLDDRPLNNRRSYLLQHATREVRARVVALASEWNAEMRGEAASTVSLAPNGSARVCIALSQPLATDAYRDNRVTGSFILIDESSFNTVAAGMVD